MIGTRIVWGGPHASELRRLYRRHPMRTYFRTAELPRLLFRLPEAPTMWSLLIG